jgi:hypothetical protein
MERKGILFYAMALALAASLLINIYFLAGSGFSVAGSGEKVGAKKLIRVPMARQATDHTCGVASLQSVLCYYGTCMREDVLGQQVGTTENGTDKDNLASYAESLGFYVMKSSNMSLDGLEKYLDSGTPVMVAIQAWEDTPVDWGNTGMPGIMSWQSATTKRTSISWTPPRSGTTPSCPSLNSSSAGTTSILTEASLSTSEWRYRMASLPTTRRR